MPDSSGPAFPHVTASTQSSTRFRGTGGDGESYTSHESHVGLTRREWFAGMALQGLLAAPVNVHVRVDYCALAWKYADAMLSGGK